MKKFLCLLVASLLIVGSVSATPPSPLTQSGQVVSRGYVTDPPRTFRLVRYVQPVTGRGSMTAESIVVWDTRQYGAVGNLADGVTVTVTTTSYDSRVAGVIAAIALSQETYGNTLAQDVGKRNWTWLQTYGFAEVRQGQSPSASGDALTTGSTLGEAGTFGMNVIDGSFPGGTRWGIAGFYLETASNSEDNVKVFLRCE